MKNKILVVEDNLRDFEFLKRILESENYSIVHALDGEKAFSLLERESPDLIILDILLPGIDGFEICKRIRQNERFIISSILFFTSSGNIDNRLLALKLGASDFLDKGCDEREILLRIKNLLRFKQRYDDMVKLSVVDSLTHVYNRRYFQHRLLDEFERSRKYNRDFCCLIIDVDKFKEVNDTYGHVAGDMVLRKIAAILRRNVRVADILCRYGGDEFGLLLPETNLAAAYAIAQRMRVLVGKTDIGISERSVLLSISCGFSSLIENNAANMEELLTQADVALYKAKRAGRNQVCCYGSKPC